jgi:short chain dehydrogenase
LFGQPVVHGMHALLWALDRWLEASLGPVRLTRLKVRFRNSIALNVGVELAVESKEAANVRFEVTADGVSLLTANVAYEPETHVGTPVALQISARIPPQEACREPTAVELVSAAGQLPLCLEPALAAQLFPNAARALPDEQLATLLAVTRVVGMEAPGRNSVLAGLELRDDRSPSRGGAVLSYRTESFDERVSRLELRVDAPGFAGAVTAFVRPEPQTQPSFVAVRGLVGPDEFRGERALVIGGSRGLGELTAKLLVAGGADVRFTYYQGAADAQRVVAELTAGGASARAFAYDVRTDAERLPNALGDWRPTLLAYFATPFITPSADRRFSVARFHDFAAYYVAGFGEAFAAVRGLGPDLTRVLYPSTVYVHELPLNLGEYAAAKAASETLCQFLTKAHRTVRFHYPRLSRLATDQTASLIRSNLPDGAAILLDALRELRAK